MDSVLSFWPRDRYIELAPRYWCQVVTADADH
jgi:hypothetical protein